MVMHGIGILGYIFGFIVKNIITILNYMDLRLIGSFMLLNGFLSVGFSLFFMIYSTYKYMVVENKFYLAIIHDIFRFFFFRAKN